MSRNSKLPIPYKKFKNITKPLMRFDFDDDSDSELELAANLYKPRYTNQREFYLPCIEEEECEYEDAIGIAVEKVVKKSAKGGIARSLVEETVGGVEGDDEEVVGEEIEAAVSNEELDSDEGAREEAEVRIVDETKEGALERGDLSSCSTSVLLGKNPEKDALRSRSSASIAANKLGIVKSQGRPPSRAIGSAKPKPFPVKPRTVIPPPPRKPLVKPPILNKPPSTVGKFEKKSSITVTKKPPVPPAPRKKPVVSIPMVRSRSQLTSSSASMLSRTTATKNVSQLPGTKSKKEIPNASEYNIDFERDMFERVNPVMKPNALTSFLEKESIPENDNISIEMAELFAQMQVNIQEYTGIINKLHATYRKEMAVKTLLLDFPVPRPNTKLLVIDLDHTICDFGETPKTVSSFSARPYLQEFMKVVYTNYEIIIWSATEKASILSQMRDLQLDNHPHYKILGSMDYNDMITVSIPYKGLRKIKALDIIWNKLKQYNKKNTIIVDDLSSNFYLDPLNGLRIEPYFQKQFTSDNELQKVAIYLMGLARYCQDFSALSHTYYSNYRKI